MAGPPVRLRYAKDLVEQARARADVQKSLDKTEETKSNPGWPLPRRIRCTPSTVTPLPTPAAVDPAMLIEAFLKEAPEKDQRNAASFGSFARNFARITSAIRRQGRF
jgi:hypothetical protein